MKNDYRKIIFSEANLFSVMLFCVLVLVLAAGSRMVINIAIHKIFHENQPWRNG